MRRSRPRQSCPVCGSAYVRPLFELPQLPVLNTVLWRSREEAQRTARGDIHLTFCPSCGHLYNRTFDPQLIEYTIGYENSLHYSNVFQRYIRDLVESLASRYALKGKTVLEIGCGQGDFLALLCERAHCAGIGFDPAYVEAPASSSGQDRTILIRDLYSPRYAAIKADLIICRQTLEHIAEPGQMLRDLRRTIGERDTPIFFEVPNALDHLSSRDVWVLIYEHISYYSPASLAAGFATAGFDVRAPRELFGTLFLGIEASPAPGAGRLPADEQSARLREVSLLVEGFREAGPATLKRWEERFKEYGDRGERVVVWGAGARCTNFLNLIRGASLVEYVVDINPRKHGTYVSGSGQKIVPPDFLVEYRPSIVVLLNPMYQREISATLAELGVQATLVGADGRIVRSVTPIRRAGASMRSHTEPNNSVALYADTPRAISALEGALVDDDVDFVEAHTYEEAIQAAEITCPDMYVVGHHFDEMQADRLIRFLRSKPWAASTPIVVIRALPLAASSRDEEKFKESYATMGAEYVSLFDNAQYVGRDSAVTRFKEAVKTHLRG